MAEPIKPSTLAAPLGPLVGLAGTGLCAFHQIPSAPFLRVLAWNPSLETLTGYSAHEINCRGLLECVFPHASDASEVLQRAFRGEIMDVRLPAVRKSGEERLFRLLTAPLEIDEVLYVATALDDVTDASPLPENHRLDSLGDLAGGIAHEFNNLLTTIIGYSSLALEHSQPIAQGYLQQVEDAARRAGELCRQMLVFAGKHRPLLETLDLNQHLKERSFAIAEQLPPQIDLAMELAPHVPVIRADGLQMMQVVSNLVSNAAEAYGGKPGIVRLKTGSSQLNVTELAECRNGSELPEGEYVWLEVIDDGLGIDPNMLLRIFDPFFTTKFAGRGLGLAAVHGIVRSHRGAIRVRSTKGGGSAFRVLLPAAGDAIDLAGVRSGCRDMGAVLIADDEETIRHLCRIVLESAGFEVLEANDGREAIECFERDKHRIRFAIIDIMMPEKDGAQVLREMREQSAQFPVLLTSGYAEREIDRSVREKGPTRFLPKPFVRDQLLDAIRRLCSPLAPREVSG
ncbi:MAG: response regulator [Gemmataceae bacterium]